MGRLARPIEDGLVYHALNRGNNGAPVFCDDSDFRAFLEALGQSQTRYPFRLLGYCLMTNHFHLLIRPEPGQSISRILQSVTVAHTWRYRKRHHASGHVWQGRFKSPLVQDDAHLLVVLRYIEANPLRAGMMSDLAEYPWSSYRHHGLGEADPLLGPVPKWQKLGRTPAERRSRWRTRVHAAQPRRELLAVRQSVQTGRPFGELSWVEKMALALDMPLVARPRGRPRNQPM
jgi:REP-associated tyrosine transposase